MTVNVANTSIALDAHSPKKDAVVAIGAPTVAENTVAIWAGANINPDLTQSIVGGFQLLKAFALSSLGGTSVARVHMPLGGGSADCRINGVVTADELVIEMGQNLGSNETDRSHFIDRTVKRLIEVWLEYRVQVNPNEE